MGMEQAVKYKVAKGAEPAAIEAIREAAEHLKVNMAVMAGTITVSGLAPAMVGAFALAAGIEKFVSSVHPPIRLGGESEPVDVGNGIISHAVRITQAECSQDLQCQIDIAGSFNDKVIRDLSSSKSKASLCSLSSPGLVLRCLGLSAHALRLGRA